MMAKSKGLTNFKSTSVKSRETPYKESQLKISSDLSIRPAIFPEITSVPMDHRESKSIPRFAVRDKDLSSCNYFPSSEK